MSQLNTAERGSTNQKGWVPVTPAERQAVREQLERILASPQFGRGKRCPSLFQYIVDRTLSGDAENLKERTLGVQVFARTPDYDSNADPVVRVTAGEVRKRIAQYYHEAGHDDEIRIDLPAGSYVAEFHLHGRSAPPVEAARPKTKWRIAAGAVVLVALTAAVALSEKPWATQSSLEAFWQPVTNSETPVVICIGPADRQRSLAQAIPSLGEAEPVDAQKAPTVLDLLRFEDVALADATTLARVSRLMGARGKTVRVVGMAATTRADLQAAPAVLIGGFNNDWTMRVTRELRFSLEADWKNNTFRITDRLNPSRDDWRTDMKLPFIKLARDYAVVARFRNPIGERSVVVAAGLGQYGTLTAGEVLTDARYMSKLTDRLPAGWQQKNIEAVVTTRVIDGNCGPPEIAGTWVW